GAEGGWCGGAPPSRGVAGPAPLGRPGPSSERYLGDVVVLEGARWRNSRSDFALAGATTAGVDPRWLYVTVYVQVPQVTAISRMTPSAPTVRAVSSSDAGLAAASSAT